MVYIYDRNMASGIHYCFNMFTFKLKFKYSICRSCPRWIINIVYLQLKEMTHVYIFVHIHKILFLFTLLTFSFKWFLYVFRIFYLLYFLNIDFSKNIICVTFLKVSVMISNINWKGFRYNDRIRLKMFEFHVTINISLIIKYF